MISRFHQVVVGRRAGRLQHEHVLAADVLVDLDHRPRRRRTARRRRCRGGCPGAARRPWASFGFALPVKTIRLSGTRAFPCSAPIIDPINSENDSVRNKTAAACVAAAVHSMAGEQGFEPSNGGIKIHCLNQLGDSPARNLFSSLPRSERMLVEQAYCPGPASGRRRCCRCRGGRFGFEPRKHCDPTQSSLRHRNAPDVPAPRSPRENVAARLAADRFCRTARRVTAPRKSPRLSWTS